MLDISQARRLSTIASNRINDERELEEEVLLDWEQQVIDFMSDPEVLDVMCDIVDDLIRDAADAGENECRLYDVEDLGYIGPTEPYPSRRHTNIISTYRDDIVSLFDAYDFLDTRRADDEICSITTSILETIVLPLYEEQGYIIKETTYRKLLGFSPLWITEFTISW